MVVMSFLNGSLLCMYIRDHTLPQASCMFIKITFQMDLSLFRNSTMPIVQHLPWQLSFSSQFIIITEFLHVLSAPDLKNLIYFILKGSGNFVSDSETNFWI